MTVSHKALLTHHVVTGEQVRAAIKPDRGQKEVRPLVSGPVTLPAPFYKAKQDIGQIIQHTN
jgi:hypothetical protein